MITCMLGEHASVTAPVMMRLAQRRVLVTAGASGIGRAIATRLHAEVRLPRACAAQSALLDTIRWARAAAPPNPPPAGSCCRARG